MSTNNITGDNLISKANSKAYADNYDRIFRKVDETDIASERENIARTAAIALIAKEASKPLPRSKKCLECGSKTVGGARWCDSGCRDTWSEREDRK